MFDDGVALLVAGCLMLPNTILQLIPVIRKRHTAPFWSYFFSLCINAGYGLLLSENTRNIGLAFVIFAFFFTIIPFDKCICKASFQCNHSACREIFSKPLSRNEFIREMCGNRALPPSIAVMAEAYHYETRTERVRVDDGDGKSHYETRTHQEKVTTWTATKIFKYRSWEEDGDSIRIKETDIIHATCPVSYKLDSSAKDGLNYLRERMYYMALHRDYYANVSNSFDTPGLKDIVCGSISEEQGNATKFYQGCPGRTLWVIFTILGYQSGFETFWCQKGERMRLKLKKKISGKKDKYRCGFMAEDEEAAKSTFRFDGESVILEEPLFLNFYNGAPINPEFLKDLPDDPNHPPPASYEYPPQGMPMQQPQQGMYSGGMPMQQPQQGMYSGGMPMQQQQGMYPQQGMPMQQQQGMYPQQGMPMQPQQQGMPQQQQMGMPPQQQGMYSGGMPPQQQGMPQQQQMGMPPQQQGMPPQQQGMPQQQQGMPQQQMGMTPPPPPPGPDTNPQ